ncbi:hypothetical protein PFISCL1PPCAC_9685, partial [Pristionchus fissidentatus]
LREKIFETLRKCSTIGVFSKTETQQFFCDVFDFFHSNNSLEDLSEVEKEIMLDVFQDNDTLCSLFKNLDGSTNLLKFR